MQYHINDEVLNDFKSHQIGPIPSPCSIKEPQIFSGRFWDFDAYMDKNGSSQNSTSAMNASQKSEDEESVSKAVSEIEEEEDQVE